MAIACAEWWARAQDLPRIQHVQASRRLHFEVLDGVPVWASDNGLDRLNRACLPEPGGGSVVVMGDSILFGVRLDLEETLGPKLQAVLPGPPGCVYNLSQPAYALENELALARRDLAGLNPDVVVWEIWENSPNHFTVVGDAAWNFGHLATDSAGLPSAFGLGPVLNKRLFRFSGLYRKLTIGRATGVSMHSDKKWQGMVDTQMEDVLAITRDSGAALVLVFASRMDRPFSETAVSGHPGYVWVRDWANARGVTTVDVAAAWVDRDVADIRIDTCCHMNALGHSLLTELLAPVVAAELER